MIGFGGRDSNTKSFLMTGDIMHEHTGSHLPDLDYKVLACERLKLLKETRGAKAPAGRFEALLAYLGQRSNGATKVDAAEVDRRLRTWFEDLISRILQKPEEWDQDMILNGKALMDLMAGTKSQPEAKNEPPA